MGIIIDDDGSYTPICNDCGVKLCWGLSETEYQRTKEYWDKWRCEACSSPLATLSNWLKQNSSLKGSIR